MADQDTVHITQLFAYDRGVKVHWTALELGLSVQCQTIGTRDLGSPEFLATNPLAQVPVVRWRGRVHTESNATCEWLVETMGSELAVLPGDPLRADYLEWRAILCESLESEVVFAYNGKSGVRRMEHYTLREKRIRRQLAALAPRLPGAHPLLGVRFTVLDVFAGFVLKVAARVELIDKDHVRPYLGYLAGRDAAVDSGFLRARA